MDIIKTNVEQKNKVVLVVTSTKETKDELEIFLKELDELTQAAGGEVVAKTYQNIKKIEASTYIGSGKAEEIAKLVSTNEANLVIFSNELSGSQIRNLENIIKARVIDRTNLILDIFAIRANSTIAKLQVELAQQKYRLPRLLGLGTSLSQTGAGIGTRGPGEQKLEIDRRRIDERIDDIKIRLKEAIKVRENTKKLRKKNNIKIVALIGYTNSGKSTVMNNFIKKYEQKEQKLVFEKDMLFATLDTYHRKIDFDDNKTIILIDTIGFVSNLPHYLIEAFKSTLEEVVDADLLVHIIDSSNKYIDMQMKTTFDVIKELKKDEKLNIINVFNKCDLIDKDKKNNEKADIYTSMKTGEGFYELVDMIKKIAFNDLKLQKMLIPYNDGNILNDIANNFNVVSMNYVEEGTLIEAELNDVYINKYERFKI